MRKRRGNENCDICYRIVCKQCGWVATEEEAEEVQAGTLTACPVCLWKPGK